MGSAFRIDCDWVEQAGWATADRHFLAEMTIQARRVSVAALADADTRMYRSGMLVSAYDLAAWFVANWWRLRWETFGEGLSWEMSHRMGAAGNGFLWPDLEIVGGDSTVLVRARPISFGLTSSVRFLNGVDVHVPATEFEAAVRGLAETVAARLESWSGEASEELRPFLSAWRELGREIDDADLSFARAIEAGKGLDPEEADPAMLDRLGQASQEVGRGPIAELVAASKGEALNDYGSLWPGVRKRSRTMRLQIGPETRDEAARLRRPNLAPWKRGVALAAVACREWSIVDGAVDNRVLSDMCGVSKTWIDADPCEGFPIPAGFRSRDEAGTLAASLKKRHPTGRRFALVRIIGDHLLAGPDERLLPVTDASRATPCVAERQRPERRCLVPCSKPVRRCRDTARTSFAGCEDGACLPLPARLC